MTHCTRASDSMKERASSYRKAPPLLTAILQRDTLPALTCTQPWATLVAVGAKQIETRSWETNYRGPLAIHTARNMPAYAQAACGDDLFRQVLQAHGYTYRSNAQANAWGLPLGQVLAIAWLEEVWRTPLPPQMQVTAQERAFGNFAPGRYAWMFSQVYRLAIPPYARGALGVWEWQPPAGLWSEVQAAYDRLREGVQR